MHRAYFKGLDAFYELVRREIELKADKRCDECGASGKLFTYATVRGAKVREHVGLFCCRDCHDRWHGLKPRERR